MRASSRMSNDQRKLSGYQYKKRRLEKETERQKQAGALKNDIQYQNKWWLWESNIKSGYKRKYGIVREWWWQMNEVSKSLHNYKFPSNDIGRHCSANYYTRILSNGEQVLRDWLVYSLSQNCVYCFCCKIFGYIVSSLLKKGFKSWEQLG